MNRLSSSVAARGVRRVLSGVVALAAAVMLVPVGAQSPAKRAMDLEDVLSFRAMGTTHVWHRPKPQPMHSSSAIWAGSPRSRQNTAMRSSVRAEAAA